MSHDTTDTIPATLSEAEAQGDPLAGIPANVSAAIKRGADKARRRALRSFSKEAHPKADPVAHGQQAYDAAIVAGATFYRAQAPNQPAASPAHFGTRTDTHEPVTAADLEEARDVDRITAIGPGRAIDLLNRLARDLAAARAEIDEQATAIANTEEERDAHGILVDKLELQLNCPAHAIPRRVEALLRLARVQGAAVATLRAEVASLRGAAGDIETRAATARRAYGIPVSDTEWPDLAPDHQRAWIAVVRAADASRPALTAERAREVERILNAALDRTGEHISDSLRWAIQQALASRGDDGAPGAEPTPDERARWREMTSPETRAFLDSIDRLRAGDANEAEALESLKTYLRATMPKNGANQ